MQQYSQILLFFYRKAAAKHSNRSHLFRKLANLLEKTNIAIDAQICSQSNNRLKCISPSSISRQIVITEATQKWLFVSSSFEKSLLFAILFKVIISQSFIRFKILKDRLDQLIKDQIFGKNTLRIIMQEWEVIKQIILNKNELLVEKQLGQSIERMPLSFYQCLLLMFAANERYQRNQIQDTFLSAVSTVLNLKVIYYQLEGKEFIKKSKYGLAEDQLYLCYIHDKEKYSVCEKDLPDNQTKEMNEK